jgi:hypothetical protein
VQAPEAIPVGVGLGLTGVAGGLVGLGAISVGVGLGGSVGLGDMLVGNTVGLAVTSGVGVGGAGLVCSMLGVLASGFAWGVLVGVVEGIVLVGALV